MVPLLVASDHLDHLAIKYNVIKELVEYFGDDDSPTGPTDIFSSMTASFSTVESKNVETLVELIQSNDSSEMCLVKRTKYDVLIPKGKTTSVLVKQTQDKTQINSQFCLNQSPNTIAFGL